MSTDVSNSSDKIKHNDHKHKNYHLYQNARIIQKNLVYVIGLSSTLSDKTVSFSLFRSFLAKNTSASMVKSLNLSSIIAKDTSPKEYRVLHTLLI